MLKLKHCTVEFPPYGVRVTFKDGTHIDGVPHYDSSHYAVISHRCGYGDDLLSYAREHDFCHEFLAEELTASPSNVLWTKAHNMSPNPHGALCEEVLTQAFQRWLRANERPIVADCPWDELKAKALELLG